MRISDNGFIDKRLRPLGSLVHDGKPSMSVGPLGTVPRMNVTLLPRPHYITTTVSIP
jgi:hypothetical protein